MQSDRIVSATDWIVCFFNFFKSIFVQVQRTWWRTFEISDLKKLTAKTEKRDRICDIWFSNMLMCEFQSQDWSISKRKQTIPPKFSKEFELLVKILSLLRCHVFKSIFLFNYHNNIFIEGEKNRFVFSNEKRIPSFTPKWLKL